MGENYINYLTPIIEKADINAVQDLEPRFIDVLEKDLLAQAEKLFKYGQDQVQSEFKRQTGEMPDEKPLTLADFGNPSDIREVITADLAISQAENISAAAATTAKQEALALIGAGVVDPTVIRNRLKESIRRTSQALTARAANSLISTAFTSGRESAADNLPSTGAFYSAVMDSGTCSPCAQNDGEEIIGGLPIVPNPECEGGSQCRCIKVYRFGG